MSEIQFDLAYLTSRESAFIKFIDICSQIEHFSVSGRIVSPKSKVSRPADSKSIPVYLLDLGDLDDAGIGERFREIKLLELPYILLYDDGNASRMTELRPPYWLHKKSLNAFELTLLLPKIEADYRLRIQAGYLKRKFHESEKRFIGVFRSKTEATIVLNRDGLIRYINPACQELFGIPQKFVGQRFPLDVQAGEILEFDLRALTGKNRTVEIVTNELIWEDELCITLTLRDTRELRRLEDELLTFRHVIHLSPLPILITDQYGTIIYINEQFSKCTGHKEEDVLGKTPRILKSNAHKPQFYKEMWDTITSGETWRGQICNKMKDGRLYWEKQVISPVRDKKGDIKFFVSIRIEDIQKRKEEKARQKAETLKSVQELAGGIAHEFSQPLQVLTISMSILEQQVADSEYFVKAQRSIQRIVELVDNLKSITALRQQDYLSTKIINIRASSEEALEKSKQQRILIIDDEPELLDSLIEVLHLSGYECDGASSGPQALDFIGNQSYSLIISDVDMPEMPGTELFKKIKESGYKGSFVFMTGYEVEEELEDTVRMADAFLSKPFPLPDLKNLVIKLVGKPLSEKD